MAPITKRKVNISLFKLTKRQTSILKALAITMIVLHNFVHWTNDIGENQNSFARERIFYLFDNIIGDPGLFFSGLFTYFGAFGVQLFIFLSGYGLAKSYARRTSVSYFRYVMPRMLKLYMLFVFGLIVSYLFLFEFVGLREYLQFSVLSLLFLPFKNYSFQSAYLHIGPWWYFGLASQLYLIFPLLYSVLNKYREKSVAIVIALSYILIYALYPLANKYDVPLFMNFVGHLPEFVLGISFAMFARLKITWKLVLPALVLFTLSNFVRLSFPFSFLTATILLLVVFYPFYAKMQAKSIVSRCLVYIGRISLHMFVINAAVRIYTIRWADGQSPMMCFALAILHYLIVVLISILMSWAFDKIYSKMYQAQK